MTQPKHYWGFDETDGVAKDTTGNANGTLTNAIRVPNGRVSGGGVVQINGSNNSFVSFGGGVGQFGTSNFTVALWLKTTEQHRYFDLVGNRTAGSHGNFFCLRMTGKHESAPAGRVSAEVDQDGNGANYIGVEASTTGLNDGNWHHVAAVRQGTSLKLYIDGKLSGQGASGGVANIANGNSFKLGQSYMGESKFAPNAQYDDLCVYDVALSDQEISNLFTNGPIPPTGVQIKSLANGAVLDVAGGQTNPQTNILVYASNGGDGQKWEIQPNGVIKSKLGNYALDMKDIPNFEWAKELVLNPINGSPTQQWEIGADGTIKNKSNGFAIALYDTGTYQVALVWYLGAPAKPYETWQVVQL